MLTSVPNFREEEARELFLRLHPRTGSGFWLDPDRGCLQPRKEAEFPFRA